MIRTIRPLMFVIVIASNDSSTDVIADSDVVQPEAIEAAEG